MKIRITFFFASLFALAGSISWGQDANPIQVNVRVYRLDPAIAENFNAHINGAGKTSSSNRFDAVARAVGHWEREGKAELIAHPVIVAPTDSWTSFDIVREITYPAEYDPATVPEKLPSKLVAGEKPGQEQAVKTNKSNVLLPPNPKEFEKRDLGLQLKVRPQLGAGGKILTDFKVEQSALLGFINYGKPIEMEKPGALRKNAKPIELLENEILMPVFRKYLKDFQVSPSAGGQFFLLDENPVPPKEAASPPPEFAELGKNHSEPDLPPLLFLVSGKKLDPKLQALPSSDSGTVAAETRSWPLTDLARRSFGLKSDQPGPPAASELKERLAEIGIQTRELTIDPVWNLGATATPEMIARLAELIPVYNANPQIYITSKFLELSEPLELDKALLSETEFQGLIRDLNQKKGVDLLSTPSVMMRPFQDGKVEIVKEFIYPVSYDAPEIIFAKGKNETSFPVTPSAPREFKTRNTGVQMGIRTRLFEDKSIELSFRPEVTEFLGFLEFGQPICVLDKGALGKYRQVVISENSILTPVFRSRSLESRVRIPSGATILVGGLKIDDVQMVQDKVPLLGDLPIIGRAARSEKEIKTPRYLYIALTAKALEGAGLADTK